jgi:RsmE family RNA methyltransferase
VTVRRFFKPFVEDELDATFAGAQRLLADPASAGTLDAVPRAGARAVVAVGPEGGWTRYEAGQLVARGFTPFTLGPRVLRVDAAVPFVVGQAQLWLRAGA